MSKFNILFKATFIATSTYFITSCATQQLSTEQQPVRKIAILSELDSHMNKATVGMTDTVNTGDMNHSIENDLAQKLWSKGTEVVILQTNSAEIMPDKKKLVLNHNSYKGAQIVLMVKPIYQKEEYPAFPAGYGTFEKSTLGIKQRWLYASIIYEVYSTKDGSRTAYYVAHPEKSEVIKLKAYDPLTKAKMLEYKPQLDTLFDQINSNALKTLGLY